MSLIDQVTKKRETRRGAVLLALGLLAGLLLHRELDPTTPAWAETAGPQRTYVLGSDSFFTTTNEEGSIIHLWYFDRAGDKRESRVYHAGYATADGPHLP